ncbi:MAG: hypothetical protein IT221_09060 [Fluviicola sp.]|nr:hypothetical protein [Fluviicola sp.]
MKYYLSILLFVAFSAIAQKENPGFLGNKNIVEISGIGHFRLINNLIRSDYHYMESNGQLVNKKRWFEYGGQIGLGRTVSKRLMIGLQASIYKQYVAPGEIYYEKPGLGSFFSKHEIIDVQSITIAPRIEFAAKRAILPIGVSHCLSFGYTMNSIKKRDYLINYDEYGINQNEKVNYNTEPTYKELSIGYSIKSRVPITKSLLFFYSFNYQLNLPMSADNNVLSMLFGSLNFSGVEGQVQKSRLYTLFTMNAGLSLSF